MHNSRSSKIDDLLRTVEAKSKHRQAEREEGPEVSWDSFSPESQEVLEYFGIEAPHLLNKYCCSVEDALLETIDRLKDAKDTIAELHKQLKIDS